MDEADKALKLQEILQKFIDSVEHRLNDEDPGGNALTAEFRVSGQGTSQRWSG